MADDDLDQAALSELSRHYDSMLWTVTSLWAAAIGGLLVYCTDHFDRWLAILGLGLTVCAMYFAASFRNVRRRVNERMTPRNLDLHVSQTPFRQWNAFLILFLVLTFSWVRLLVSESEQFWVLWSILGVLAAVSIVVLWRIPDRKPRNAA